MHCQINEIIHVHRYIIKKVPAAYKRAPDICMYLTGHVCRVYTTGVWSDYISQVLEPPLVSSTAATPGVARRLPESLSGARSVRWVAHEDSLHAILVTADN